MVNNAGVSSKMHRSFLDDDLADFQRVMSVNVLGVMAGTRDAARQMATSGGGSIINMSSIGGIQAGGGVMTYRASKAAVIMFTKSAGNRVGALRGSGQRHRAGQHTHTDSGVVDLGQVARRTRTFRADAPRADARRPAVAAGRHSRRCRRGRAVPGQRQVAYVTGTVCRSTAARSPEKCSGGVANRRIKSIA